MAETAVEHCHGARAYRLGRGEGQRAGRRRPQALARLLQHLGLQGIGAGAGRGHSARSLARASPVRRMKSWLSRAMAPCWRNIVAPYASYIKYSCWRFS